MEQIEEGAQDKAAAETEATSKTPTTQMNTITPMDYVNIPALIFNPLPKATKTDITFTYKKEGST